jgi:hypothetical protein
LPQVRDRVRAQVYIQIWNRLRDQVQNEIS